MDIVLRYIGPQLVDGIKAPCFLISQYEEVDAAYYTEITRKLRLKRLIVVESPDGADIRGQQCIRDTTTGEYHKTKVFAGGIAAIGRNHPTLLLAPQERTTAFPDIWLAFDPAIVGKIYAYQVPTDE